MDAHLEKQHRILFLYSLSPALRERAEKEGFSVSKFISSLSGLENVELRELTEEALSFAGCRFKAIVFLAHHDYSTDSLVLSDGSPLPLARIAASLPVSLDGVMLDFAVCSSSHIADEIKRANPKCHVQTANSETDLKLRMTVYMALFQYLNANPSADYHEAYLACLDRIKTRQERQALPKLPSTTKLGDGDASEDITSSVFAKNVFTRGYTFKVQVWLHTDSKEEIVEVKARGCDPMTHFRDTLTTLKGIHIGDEIDIDIRFLDATGTPTDLIYVTDGGDTRHLAIRNEIESVIFDAKVSEEYPHEQFSTKLGFQTKGGERCSYEFETYQKGVLRHDDAEEPRRRSIAENSMQKRLNAQPGGIRVNYKKKSLFLSDDKKKECKEVFQNFLKKSNSPSAKYLDAKTTNYVSMSFAAFYKQWQKRGYVDRAPNGSAIFRFLTADCDCHIEARTTQKTYELVIRSLILQDTGRRESTQHELEKVRKQVEALFPKNDKNTSI